MKLKDIVILRLEQLGEKSGIARARRVGLGRDFIRDIVAGRKDSVQSDKLDLLAAALELDAKALADGKLVPAGEVETFSQEELDLIADFRLLPEGMRQAVIVLTRSGKTTEPTPDKS